MLTPTSRASPPPAPTSSLGVSTFGPLTQTQEKRRHDRHTIAEAFAAAASRLTSGVDQAGDLVALLIDCTAPLGAESAGLLVEVPGEGLELLSSTSHATDVLELYELQNGLGPCIQAVHDNTEVWADRAGLANGWPPVGRAIAGAGYTGVHAFPLRWQHQAVGLEPVRWS